MSELEVNPFADAASPTVTSDDEGEQEQESHTQSPPPRPADLTNCQAPKTSFCCNVDKTIASDDFLIRVTNAQKATDASGSSYIAYTIRLEDQEVRRRYSEFESLRKGLSRLYPTVIVPPIPEKHSFADYATMQSKAKEDAGIIEKRKRMLQTFLNRVARHPHLSNEHVFHKFLESGVNWNEVLHSAPLSNLPKNILQVSSVKPPSQNSGSPTTSYDGSAILGSLPMPSSSQQLRNPDPRFQESEMFTQKFSSHMNQTMEKTNRRILKRLGDLSNDYNELGAIYNGFSLNEIGELANAIEKVGQAVDNCFMATGHLTTSLEADFSEPLQEYAQFAQIIKEILKYRHMKNAQVELIADTLDKQKHSLENLERSEQEAKRIEAALNRTGYDNGARQRRGSADSEDVENDRLENGRDEDDAIQNGDHPDGNPFLPHSTVVPNRVPQKKRSGTKLFSVISHTFHGIMDVDPEATRRNSIGKTRETIMQLEEALETSQKDLKNISMAIQADLDRFQRQKVCDFRDMLISYAKHHAEWCRKNLASWEEARAEIEKIQ